MEKVLTNDFGYSIQYSLYKLNTIGGIVVLNLKVIQMVPPHMIPKSFTTKCGKYLSPTQIITSPGFQLIPRR